MSTELPRLESRVSAQERMQTILHARVEELSEDMTASFGQQAAYQVQFEQKVDARFDQVDARFNGIDVRLDKIEANMVAMEGRILDAFQQLVTIIDTRLPPQAK